MHSPDARPRRQQLPAGRQSAVEAGAVPGAGLPKQEMPAGMLSVEYVRVWYTPQQRPPVSMWRPVCARGYAPLGDVVCQGMDPPPYPVRCTPHLFGCHPIAASGRVLDCSKHCAAGMGSPPIPADCAGIKPPIQALRSVVLTHMDELLSAEARILRLCHPHVDAVKGRGDRIVPQGNSVGAFPSNSHCHSTF